VLLDATLGMAGHAMAILGRHQGLQVVGIDRDMMAIQHANNAKATLAATDAARFSAVHARFDAATDALRGLGIHQLSGALFDLGVSSPQLDLAERGFSYRNEAPLDMRMDRTEGVSAWHVVNEYSADTITDILRRNADERFAKRIAQAIVAARPITTTTQLAAVVTTAIPAATRRTGGHPAKRTFQAIRIEVNSELEILPNVVPQRRRPHRQTGHARRRNRPDAPQHRHPICSSVAHGPPCVAKSEGGETTECRGASA
jgi:16S rRNA (cytosine1402-N4)-methyltransferase